MIQKAALPHVAVKFHTRLNRSMASCENLLLFYLSVIFAGATLKPILIKIMKEKTLRLSTSYNLTSLNSIY